MTPLGSRTRLLLSVAALVASTLLVASARADDESGVLDSRHGHFESPQHWAMEIRFAPYRPRVDFDPSLTGTPYADVFGTMPRLEMALELDWQALRIPHLGTVGPGVSVGYTSMGNKARLTNPSPGQNPISGENTSLDIYPFYGVIVLRADVLMREVHVPLVPYAKGGIGFALWRASNDLGTSHVADGNGGTVDGKGHTWGAHVALGLALHLNAFDEHAARGFDNNVGVNHTYLFAEYMRSMLTGLGQTHALYVGTNTWAGGLAFEF